MNSVVFFHVFRNFSLKFCHFCKNSVVDFVFKDNELLINLI